MPSCDTCALLMVPENADIAQHYRICGWQPRALPEPVLHLENVALRRMSPARWITLKVIRDDPHKLPPCSCWQPRKGAVAEMVPEEHLRRVGGIILNLQALELTLRRFLVEASGQTMYWPRPTDTLVPENYITNYMPLGPIIDDFNQALNEVEKQKFTVDRSMVDVRDTLAHGRVGTWTESFPVTLWKFGKPKDGKVPVSSITLTRDWLVTTSSNVEAQRVKVVECSKARGYKILS
jgi:hypothetical protein